MFVAASSLGSRQTPSLRLGVGVPGRLENEIQVRTPTVTGPLFLYPALYTLIHTTHDIRNKTVNTVKQNQVVYFKVALPGVPAAAPPARTV